MRSNGLISLIFLVSACSARQTALPADNARSDAGPDYDPSVITVPFLVDDHYVPSGCMGDCAEAVTIDSDCKERASPDAQGACHHFVYAPVNATSKAVGWAGVLWQTDERNWGSEPRWPVAPGATKIHFFAKATRTPAMPGGVAAPAQVTFLIGGMNAADTGKKCVQGSDCASGNCVSSACTEPFHDTLNLSTPPQTLPTQFQAFDIPFEGRSYGQLVLSGFGWTATKPGALGTLELFVDDIRWE